MPAKDALAAAKAALRRDDREAAANWACELLDADPALAGEAHLVLGVLAERAGRLGEAEAAYECAVRCAPGRADYRMALGNLAFARGDMAAAEGRFREALAFDPFSPSVHNNLAQTLKRQGWLREALGHFRQSLELGRASRWFSRSSALNARSDPLRAGSFTFTSRAKLEHDIEQFEYLLAKKALPASFAKEIEAYRSVRDSLPLDDPNPLVRLNDTQRASIGESYNRVVHVPRQASDGADALNARNDMAAVERSYNSATPCFAMVDDLLSAEALARLRSFCLDATIWFDCKADGGYLGAYMHEGFDAPVLLAIADALRERLPGIVGGMELTQMWAFKYRSRGQGTRLHADQAAVNVNFWITPDGAALPGEAGGLRVWDVPAPADWSFDAYNRDPAPIEVYLRRKGARAIDVPYRYNRAVIFDSSLFHETLPFAFRPGYENRRINVTMLFGRRRAA